MLGLKLLDTLFVVPPPQVQHPTAFDLLIQNISDYPEKWRPSERTYGREDIKFLSNIPDKLYLHVMRNGTYRRETWFESGGYEYNGYTATLGNVVFTPQESEQLWHVIQKAENFYAVNKKREEEEKLIKKLTGLCP